MVVVVVVVLSFFVFPRLRGYWESVRPFIPRLRFFFFIYLRLARALYTTTPYYVLDRPTQNEPGNVFRQKLLDNFLQSFTNSFLVRF